ncbi:MAG: hypothetical protein H5T86_06620 [Armatimonadetes bacterium]|nr:hypothetical protein [Armatimonadota bacterium]
MGRLLHPRRGGDPDEISLYAAPQNVTSSEARDWSDGLSSQIVGPPRYAAGPTPPEEQQWRAEAIGGTFLRRPQEAVGPS